jgi:hypothetical protein
LCANLHIYVVFCHFCGVNEAPGGLNVGRSRSLIARCNRISAISTSNATSI